MSTISTNQFKKGVTVMFKNGVCTIVGAEFVNPGKGSAFVRTRLKNVQTGNVVEHTFKSSETIEEAPTELVDMQYLYSDETSYYFMNTQTYEQVAVDAEMVGDDKNYLKEEETYIVVLHENRPITVRMPAKIKLKVTEAEPNVKGDSTNSAEKNITVETGFIMRAPVFINAGESILVNTETGAYVERAK